MGCLQTQGGEGSQVTAVLSRRPQPPARWRVWEQRHPPVLLCVRHDERKPKSHEIVSSAQLPPHPPPMCLGAFHQGPGRHRELPGMWDSQRPQEEAGPGDWPGVLSEVSLGDTCPCLGSFLGGMFSVHRRKPLTPATSGCPGSPQGPLGSGLSSLQPVLCLHGPWVVSSTVVPSWRPECGPDRQWDFSKASRMSKARAGCKVPALRGCRLWWGGSLLCLQ